MKKPVLAVLILLAGGLLARGETLTSLGGGGMQNCAPVRMQSASEVQSAIDSSYFPAGQGALMWGGGSRGTWDDTSLNWYTEEGTATAWNPGAIAVFPISAAINVAGAKSVAKLINVADAAKVIFIGDALTFTTAESVRFGANGVFRFENELSGELGYSQAIADSPDAVLKMDEPIYLVSTEARKVLPTAAKLADIETFSVMVQGFWGSVKTPVRLTNDKVEKGHGLYNWTYDEATKSVTFILKYEVDGGLGVIVDAVKIKLEEREDGVYASTLYTKSAIGNFDLTHGEKTTWDCDFDAYPFRGDCGVFDQGVNLDNYKLHIYDFQCSLKGVVPTEMGVEIAGNCAVSGTYSLEVGSFRTVDAGSLNGGVFSSDVTVRSGVLLEFASTTAVEIKGKLASEGTGRILVSGSGVKFTADKPSRWILEVAGQAFASGYRTLPTDGSIKVLENGELSIGSMYYEWGPDGGGAPIYIYTNGVVRLVRPDAMGVWKHWYLVGGAVTNENTKTGYPLVYRFHMNDGATFTGARAAVGYKGNFDEWSFIEAGGSSPSTFAADDLMIGYQAPAERANHKIGVKFVVADVTGDDAPDFILKSPIVDREGAVLYKGEAVRENCGVWKTGPGTMLLTAATHNEPQGVFKIDEGAVRFGATCGGQLGALLVTGDAALEVEDDAGVAFADSSAVSWTEGKTLTLKSRIGKKSLRFGTDDKGLTAAQLAAIRYDESVTTKKTAFTLDANGYLRDGLSGGFCIRIR